MPLTEGQSLTEGQPLRPYLRPPVESIRPWEELEQSDFFKNADFSTRNAIRAKYLQVVANIDPAEYEKRAPKVFGKDDTDTALNSAEQAQQIMEQREAREPWLAKVAKGVVEFLVPGGEYLTDPAVRERFMKLPAAQQMFEIGKVTAEAELALGGGYILKGLGWAGSKALQFITRNPTFNLGEWFRGTKAGQAFVRASTHLGDDPAGKELLTSEMRIAADGASKAAAMVKVLKDSGIKELTKKESETLAELMFSNEGATRAEMLRKIEALPLKEDRKTLLQSVYSGWSDVAETIGKDAVAAGVQMRMPNGELVPIKLIPNYFPRMMAGEFEHAIKKDVMLFRKAVHQVVGGASTDEALEAAVSAGKDELFEQAYRVFQQAKKKLNPLTERLVRGMVQEGIVPSEPHALARLALKYDSDLVGFYGHLDRPRLAKALPSFAYNKDFFDVATKYVLDATARIAQVAEWGPRAERLMATLSKIQDPEKYALAEKVVRSFTGRWPVKERLNPSTQQFLRQYTAFNVLTRIGMGFATIPNLFQPVISTLMEAGYTRGIAAAFRYLTSPAFREEIRATGATIGMDAMKLLTGHGAGSSWLDAAAQASLKLNLFTPVNRAWNVYAAATGNHYVRDLAKMVAKGRFGKEFPTARARLAEAKLSELGVDVAKIGPKGELPQEELRRGVFHFAMRSQLQHTPWDEPILMNHPKYKEFWLFKRFGYKQAAYMYDVAVKRFLQDPMPLLRLAAGGILGGELVAPARFYAGQLARHVLRGEPIESWADQHKDEPFIQRILRDFAAIGSFGMISDWFWGVRRSGEEEITPFSIAANVLRTPMPVQVSDVTDVMHTLSQIRQVPSDEPLKAVGIGLKHLGRYSPVIGQVLKEE